MIVRVYLPDGSKIEFENVRDVVTYNKPERVTGVYVSMEMYPTPTCNHRMYQYVRVEPRSVIVAKDQHDMRRFAD